jgi:soluble lytic murein transglycosylase-like protein
MHRNAPARSPRIALPLALLAGGLGLPAGTCPAEAAQVVTFASGNTLEVESVLPEGAMVRLRLAGGGEMSLPAERISRVAPSPAAGPSPAPEPAPRSPASAGPPPENAPGRPEDAIRVSPLDPEPGVRALIRRLSPTHRVDARLVEAVVRVESNYDPFAVSRRGAMGLMQLMPATARRYGVTAPFDPAQNLEGGVRYLRELLDRYGEVRLALAAYNAGEEAVDRYRGVPPYRETRHYVARILRILGS